jgi:hypothetical protein
VTSVITSIASLITSAALFIGAFAVILPQVRRTKASVDDVHQIVNQQRTDAKNYNNLLEDSLRSAGIDVPPDVSLMPGEDDERKV